MTMSNYCIAIQVSTALVCWLACAEIALAQNAQNDRTTKVSHSRDVLISNLPVRVLVSRYPDSFPIQPGGVVIYSDVSDVAVTDCILKLSTTSSRFVAPDGSNCDVKC